MWNKLLLSIALVLLLTGMLAAQNSNRRNPRGRITTVTAQSAQKTNRKTEKRNTAPALRFDPAKPSITQEYVAGIRNELRKQLLERKISSKMPDLEKSDEEEDEEKKTDKDTEKKDEPFTSFAQTDYRIATSQFRQLADHFELEEVTGIQRNWYKQFLAELDKFEPILFRMYLAIRREKRENYRIAAREFEQHQKVCLKLLDTEKKARLRKEYIEQLKKRNTEIRQQNHLKRLRAEREAAMKRRQEMLKKPQQQNKKK